MYASSTIKMKQCHARNAVHGESIACFEPENQLLYEPLLLSIMVNLSCTGILALARKPVSMPEDAGSEHLASLSRNALTIDQWMEQMDTVSPLRILQ
jgi:hypothetical protein